MKEQPVYEEKFHNLTINIYQDDDLINPIKEWDMLGSFICWHRNYNLCSKDVLTNRRDASKDQLLFESPDDFKDWLKENPAIVLPLFLYDHSGITIRTTTFNDRWDSGQVGYVFVTEEKIKKEYSKKRISNALRNKVEEILKAEVKTFDDYLTGNVYGYTVDNEKVEQLASCWEFYGDYEGECLTEAREEAKYYYEKQQKEKAIEQTIDGLGCILQLA